MTPEPLCAPVSLSVIPPFSFLSPQLGEGLGAKETPQQRYQRLQHEVQELIRDVEQIQVSAVTAPGPGGGTRTWG